METYTLVNRYGLKIVGDLHRVALKPRGTAIIEHGWSGNRNEPHIVALKDLFVDKGFTVFNFDATNSFNESEGEYANSRLGLHYNDLEDVVAWVQTQDWFASPLLLSGHSMGGYTSLRYAEEHPDAVRYVVSLAPLVNGKLYIEAKIESDSAGYEKWKRDGVLIKESATRPGLFKASPYEAVVEMQGHDLLPEASSLTMPVFLLTGTLDTSLPPAHLQILFDAIPGNLKSLHLLEGAHHNYSEDEVKTIVSSVAEWLDTQSINT